LQRKSILAIGTYVVYNISSAEVLVEIKHWKTKGVGSMELAVCRSGLDDPQATTHWLLENEAYIIETGPDFFLNSDNGKIESTARIFTEKGISIRSIHAPFGGNCNLSDPDAEKRASAVRTHRELLYRAAPAEVEMIIIHPGVGGFSSQEDMDKANLLAYESISQLIDAAEETGVALALENMLPGHPGCEIRHILDIVERIDSPYLDVCFDSGHAHVCGNMKEFMEAMGEHTISIHMQDNDGTRDMHIQPPYGTTDWRAFVEVLRKINYQRPITIEARPWGGASYKQMLKETSAVLEAPEDTSFRCQNCGHIILRSKGQWFCNCGNDD
jgi:sugar phosphate isomerase/epimerase